jgi:hypothetical protein
VQNLPRAPPRGGGNFSFLGKFLILCEPLDLLLFKTGNFSNKFPRGRKFDRFAADSAPLLVYLRILPKSIFFNKKIIKQLIIIISYWADV